jgi:dipeptidyl aminopeptidase/acylaminoacyl peptidase
MGDGVYFVTARRDRLVFSRGQLKPAQIWRMPGRTVGVREREARVLIASSQQEYQPSYSPDGRRIAFSSDRAGVGAVWTCDADGANPVQLVDMPSDSASWSPDGLRIAFDSLASGNYDLYVVDAEGGAPKRLTDAPSSDNEPTFSSDGSQIYFTSDRSGRPEVWRMPAAGGPAVQLTRGGGDNPREMSGRELYFRRGGSIRRASLTGEGEVEVLRGHFAAALSPVGIYYFTLRWQTRLRRLEYGVNFLDFASGRSAVLATQSGAVSPHTLAVSPDGSWLLLGVRFTNESELMLVENFR